MQGAFQGHLGGEVAVTCPASPQYESLMGFHLYYAPSVMNFPFLFYFTLLFRSSFHSIPFHSIQTAFPPHSHVMNPRGSPRFPYLPFYS